MSFSGNLYFRQTINVYKTQAKANNVSQEKTKKITLNIGGMSCINCAHTIEKELAKLNGVTQATVNLAAEQALIDYNPDLITQKTIETVITDSGYHVIHEKIVLQIGGMSCVNCAKTIEKALWQPRRSLQRSRQLCR